MITMDDAILHLRKVVESQGEDFVYTRTGRCVYVDGSEPSCLVGHVFHALGVNMQGEFYRSRTAIPSTLVEKGLVDMTPEASQVLRAAQVRQDRMQTWGEALAGAEALYRNLGGEL